MFDLEKAVTDACRSFVEGGKLSAMVESHVGKMLDEILRDALRSYGDIGKQISEAVKKSLAIDTGQLGLSSYNATVLAIVKQRLDAAVHKVGTEKLAADMDALLGTNAPAEIKLSELICEFKKWAADETSDDRCTIIVDEQRYGSRWLNLDPSRGKEKYQCRFSILMPDDGNALVSRIDGADPSKSLMLGVLYGFAKRLFQIYAAGTRVIVDETDFDNYLEREGDE